VPDGDYGRPRTLRETPEVEQGSADVLVAVCVDSVREVSNERIHDEELAPDLLHRRLDGLKVLGADRRTPDETVGVFDAHGDHALKVGAGSVQSRPDHPGEIVFC
jgi:hypothetical protein